MKNYIIFWLMCGSVVAYGQSPPWFEATSNQVAAGVVGAPFAVTPRGLAGAGIGSPTNGVTAAQVGTQIASTNDSIIKAAITNTSSLVVGLSNNIVQMSAASGGNTYDDMRSASNLYPRHALGVSYSGDDGAALWASITGPGLGSNVWGIPIELPGGGNLGNPFWVDLPRVPYLDQGVYFGMGPHASMLTNAWPNGMTNGSVQPAFIVENGNPYSGYTSINIRGAFTNASHGDLVGTTAGGVNVYEPLYGLTLGVIGESYGNPTNGVIDQLGKYSQQAPSYQGGLLSDYTLNYYLSLNAHRPGDAPYGGQAPLFTIENDKFLGGDNEIIAGFPVQLANVWDVRQSAWLWALSVDERTSSPTVSTTNSLFQAGAMDVKGLQTNESDIYIQGVVHGNGSGLTNSSGYTFASTNQILGTTNLAAVPGFAFFNGATNLGPTWNGSGLSNLIAWTHEGTTTNITATFNGTLQTFTCTNGPSAGTNYFLHFLGANGSVSYRFASASGTYNVLNFDYQPKWLAGSNNVITNGVLTISSYGGTNVAFPSQLEAAMKENQ